MAGIKHEPRGIALARVSCSCGWFWRNDKLKGKTDVDLTVESQEQFDKHKAVFDK